MESKFCSFSFSISIISFHFLRQRDRPDKQTEISFCFYLNLTQEMKMQAAIRVWQKTDLGYITGEANLSLNEMVNTQTYCAQKVFFNILNCRIFSCLLITSQPPPSALSLLSLTHEVGHYLAHGGSEDEVLEDAGDEGEGHAEHGHHQVADCERQQEGVGHGAHALIDRQHHNDEQVANYTQEEDE